MAKEKQVKLDDKLLEEAELKELVGDAVEERFVKIFEDKKKAKKEKKKADENEEGKKPTKFIDMRFRLLRTLRPKVEERAEYEGISMNAVMNNMIEAYDPEEFEKLKKKVESLQKQVKKLKEKAK
jgi:hypothetical protein